MLNKKRIDEYIGYAITELEGNQEIVKNGKIEKTFSSQISTFGVAVSTGSLLSAIAFFSRQGEASVERNQLMKVIYGILKKDEKIKRIFGEYFNSVKDTELLYQFARKLLCNDETKNHEGKDDKQNNRIRAKEFKNLVLDAAVAVKLAMNYFDMK
ncbi:MAG: hypothetical protein HUJ88_11140 [Fusobacterium necrophorum]|nr:hypothetical protein [Fusobacterium necrophorum]